MIRQQEILREHFEKQGAKVEMQPFRVPSRGWHRRGNGKHDHPLAA